MTFGDGAIDTIDRDRSMGGIFMSADIIRFIPRPKHDRGQTDFPTIAFRLPVRHDDPLSIIPTQRLANTSRQTRMKTEMTKTITEIRSIARSHTRTAINVLVGIM